VGRRKEKLALTYVYDSREQRAYDMARPDPKLFDDGGWYEDALDAGDITAELDAVRLSLRIERKEQGDFIGCCRHDRGCEAHQLGNDPRCGARCRFERELSRLTSFDHAHVIIEAPMAQLENGYIHSMMSGDAVINSIACWATRYRVHFWTVANRAQGQKWARQLILEAAKHRA